VILFFFENFNLKFYEFFVMIIQHFFKKNYFLILVIQKIFV
jgi:hypothetical protein